MLLGGRLNRGLKGDLQARGALRQGLKGDFKGGLEGSLRKGDFKGALRGTLTTSTKGVDRPRSGVAKPIKQTTKGMQHLFENQR